MTTHPRAGIGAALVCAALAAAQGNDANERRSNPMFRGWLIENLRLDTERARLSYERGARDVDEEPRTKALCLARLAELDQLEGRSHAASKRLLSLESIGVGGIQLRDTTAIQAAREKIDAARADTDRKSSEAQLTAARKQLVEANVEGPARPRGVVDQVHERVVENPGADAELVARRRERPNLRRREAWIEVLKLHLLGEHDRGERLAWYAFGFRPWSRGIGSDPIVFTNSRMKRLEASIEDQDLDQEVRLVLAKLRDRIRAILGAGRAREAAELIRRIPLPRG